MRKRKLFDITAYTPLSRRSLYIRVIFWVFLAIMTIEAVILSSTYMIHFNSEASVLEEVAFLFGLGCAISIAITMVIIIVLHWITQVHTASSLIWSEEDTALHSDLKTAIEEKNLLIFYQPQINLQTGQVVGMETLVRWPHPSKGFILPGDFIHIAEETGLIMQLGHWVLCEACKYNKKLLEQGYDLRVAVNLSPIQFENPKIVEEIANVLKDTQLPPKNLELEITETAMLNDITEAIKVMKKLQDLGVSLSMDDFGTGYSSLSHLDQFPIKKIKIDKAFVHSISPYDDEPNIADSIIQMGHKLNLIILAEGIENEYQKKYFTELKCDEGQGYYFGKPVPAIEFSRLLKR